MLRTLERINTSVVGAIDGPGRPLLTAVVGLLFVWLGLLKPFGDAASRTILDASVYFGDPEQLLVVLGWWEVAIGICLVMPALQALALPLLILRLPGILLAFVFKLDACFYSFPLAPTAEGKYLLRDLALFLAAIALAARRSPTRHG